MVVRWLMQFYHNYALFLGVTSHRLVNGRFQQTWLTRSYAFVLNVITLLLLPYSFWFWSNTVNTADWMPNLISFTTYLLYVVVYMVIAYTIISRGSRDAALLEIERIVTRLKGKKEHKCVRGSLGYMFYLKLISFTFMCIATATASFFMPTKKNLFVIVCGLLYCNTLNIPAVAIYRYFLTLWNIAYCYQYIDTQLERIIGSVKRRNPRQTELQELHRLWSLHALLSRSALRINQIYGLLLLAARIEILTFSVINGYWGILFSFSMKTPIMTLFYGACNYNMRIIDFYLLHYVIDLTLQYQSSAHHAVTEGIWFKEVYLQLNAYLIYASTSKMSFWVCGLYKMNRRAWYNMLGSILTLSMVLLQFHLLVNKFSL